MIVVATLHLAQKTDAHRLKLRKVRNSKKYKKYRKLLKSTQLREEEQRKQKEGLSYGTYDGRARTCTAHISKLIFRIIKIVFFGRSAGLLQAHCTTDYWLKPLITKDISLELFSTLLRARPAGPGRHFPPEYRLDTVFHIVAGGLSLEHSSNDVLGSDREVDFSRKRSPPHMLPAAFGKRVLHRVCSVRTEQTGRADDIACLEQVGPKIPVAREKLGNKVIDFTQLSFHPWSNVRDES
ncbi:hypothetical protein J6590_022732 [Homalodisca vitripennis]|nr:hypothetical protein J6590_022732 [Homalodisca vitripennis]